MYASEMFDKKMQEGYEEHCRGNETEACRIWKQVWLMFLNLVDSTGTESIKDFDNRFPGTQCVFNWVQDYEQALGNAGQNDRAFYQDRIEFCHEFLQRFESSSDELMVQNMKQALAESHFILGQKDKADSLFEQWLKEDPKWGWGWIGWADCWMFFSSKKEDDLEKAVELLYRGLAVEDVSDKEFIYERLADLYHDMGMAEEADSIDEMKRTHVKLEEMKMRYEAVMTGLTSKAQNQKKQAVSIKVGRNEPCPCGSGKKYKKCCGR